MVKFDKIRAWVEYFEQIQLSNFIKFELRPQIRPRIQISNSTFLVEFRIILIRIRNSSELSPNRCPAPPKLDGIDGRGPLAQRNK